MHFTYQPPDKAHLYQGDLVKRSSEINDILREIHPTYLKDDYRYFIIITQSCDLVRRGGGSCNARYINLAAVRPINIALKQAIEEFQYNKIERHLGFISESRKQKLHDFMERLFNNNEPNYFFLYREPNLELDDSFCAFLRLSIAIKADLHYDKLLESKILQLSEPFRAKLGFLVGYLYSRIATEDWLPDQCTRDRFQRYITEPLEDPELILWVEAELHKKLIRRFEDIPLEDQTIERLEAELEELRTSKQAKREEVLNTIATELSKFSLDPEIIENIKRRLESNPQFRSYIK